MRKMSVSFNTKINYQYIFNFSKIIKKNPCQTKYLINQFIF